MNGWLNCRHGSTDGPTLWTSTTFGEEEVSGDGGWGGGDGDGGGRAEQR